MQIIPIGVIAAGSGKIGEAVQNGGSGAAVLDLQSHSVIGLAVLGSVLVAHWAERPAHCRGVPFSADKTIPSSDT